MFILKCASCQQQVNVSSDFSNQVVNCPVCGKGISVPGGSGGTHAEGEGAARGGNSGAGGTGSVRNFSPAWSEVSDAASSTKQSFASTMQPPVAGGGYGGMATPAASRLVYILLAIFLGTLGIHNFVIGLNGRGASQLVLTVIGVVLFPCTVGLSSLLIFVAFVWSILDIVLITRDARGNSLN